MSNNITQDNNNLQENKVVYLALVFVAFALSSLSIISQANFFIEQTGANHHWVTMVYASFFSLGFIVLGGLGWVFLPLTTNSTAKVFWVIIITLSILLEMVAHLYYWQQGSNKSVAATEQGLVIKERIASLNRQVENNNLLIETINGQLTNNDCAKKYPTNQLTKIRNCENKLKDELSNIKSLNNDLGLQLDEKTKALNVIAPSTMMNFNLSIQKFLNLDIDFKLIMSFLMSVFVSISTNMVMGMVFLYHFPNRENIQYSRYSPSTPQRNKNIHVDKAIIFESDRNDRNDRNNREDMVYDANDYKKKDIVTMESDQIDMPSVRLIANKLALELDSNGINQIADYFKNHEKNSVRGVAAVKNMMGIRINPNTISAARKELSDYGCFDGFSTKGNVFKKP